MHRHMFSLLAVVLAALSPVQSARELRDTSSSSSDSGSSSLPSAWTTGIATNYGGPSEGKDPASPSFGTEEGSCGYGEMDKTKYPYWSVAALSPSNSFYVAGPTGACGQCFEIQCINSGGNFPGRCNADPSQRSVTVMISDVCPECESNHIDIQALTYKKMAPMLGGRIDIQYRRVECTPPSNLNVMIDKNSGTGGFLKMSVTTAGGSGGISSVQVKGGGSDGWTGLTNLYGSMWELDTQPQLPLDIHVTADSGQELTAFGVIDKNGQTGTLPTGVQFSFSGPPSFDEASSIRSSEPSSTSSTSDSSASSSSSSSSSSSPSASASASAGSSSSSSSSSGGSSSSSGGSSASADGGGSASAEEAQVSAYDGPTPSSPKARSPSGKDSPPSSRSSSSSSSSGACNDVAIGKNSCSQEKAWGHCSSSWMKKASSSNPKGYCAKTCGRC